MRGTPEDHILDRVDQSRDHHWLWKGTINHDGYGVFMGRDKRYRRQLAHRASYRIFVGPVSLADEVGHVDCPHRRCVSPACLRVMSHEENMAMTRK